MNSTNGARPSASESKWTKAFVFIRAVFRVIGILRGCFWIADRCIKLWKEVQDLF